MRRCSGWVEAGGMRNEDVQEETQVLPAVQYVRSLLPAAFHRNDCRACCLRLEDRYLTIDYNFPSYYRRDFLLIFDYL